MTKLHMISMFAGLILIIGLVSCHSSPGDASYDKTRAEAEVQQMERDARREIDNTRNAYVSAWQIGNAAQIAELYTDDAFVLYPNQPAVSGRSAILDYFKVFFSDFPRNEFALYSDEVVITGQWAFDRGTYRWKGIARSSGGPVEDNGKYLVILQRQADGKWKVARDMDNSDRLASQATRGTN